MTWDKYYERFYDWAESTRLRQLSSLTDFGDPDEICEIANELPGEKAASKLIRKAIVYGIQFSTDNIEELEGVIDARLLEELSASLAGKLTWQQFYDCIYNWPENLQLKNSLAQKEFGPSEEVCEIAVALFDEDTATKFINNAFASGVRFNAEEIIELADYIASDSILNIVESQKTQLTEKQLDELSCFLNDDDIQKIAEISGLKVDMEFDEDIEEWEELSDSTPRRKGLGFLGALAIIASLLGGSKDNRNSGRCNGDCANCPPHYGYRYGRWYYGHHHTRGCQRGGNFGGGGPD